MNVALLISILTIPNLLLVACVLFTKSKSSLSNRLLALVLLMPVLYYLRHFAELMGYRQIVTYLLFPTHLICVLYGPLVYAYTHNMLGDKRWRHPVLFPMSLLLVVFNIIRGFYYTFFLSGQEQIAYALQVQSGDFPLMFLISDVVIIVLHFCYLLFAFTWTLRIARNCKYATDLEKQKNHFVLQLLVLKLALLFFLLISYTTISVHQVDSYSLPITGAFFYLFVFYKMFQRPLIFDRQAESMLQVVVNPDSVCAVEAKSSMERPKNWTDPEVMDTIYADLVLYMEAEKPYMNPNLSLNNLSDALKISTHKLSLAINEKSGNNFFNFINSYRIAEARRLLGDTKAKSFNIEDIAFMSGFNSRAAFYTAFKKQLNKTPSVYLAESKIHNLE